VTVELIAGAVKAVVMILIGLNLALFLLYFERKGSALIQDRIGSNRASITGFGKRMGLPNLGIINTVIADPIKMFTKEDFIPAGADRALLDFDVRRIEWRTYIQDVHIPGLKRHILGEAAPARTKVGIRV